MIPDPPPERLLAIGAHPDDIDFGAGGTIARFTTAGTAVTYCVITDGDAGGYDPAVPRTEIPRIRQREQRAAAAELGVTDIHFLGYRDGELTVTHGLRRDLSRVIRQVRPELVIVQSPVRNFARIHTSHPDHLAAGEASLQAIYPDARNPFAHPTLLTDEGLAEWTVPRTWVMGATEPDTWVDITATIERKVSALRRHESQTAHMDLDADIPGWAARNAAEAELAEGSLVEGFRALDTA